MTRGSIESADTICQCLEYFLKDNRDLIGKMVVLSTFEVAANLYARLLRIPTGDSTLDESLVRRAGFAAEIRKRIGGGGLPIWRDG